MPLHAGCTVQLPREIQLKRAAINVCSNDNACFAWSVVAALHPSENHVYRTSAYPHYSTVLNIQDIEFQMTLKQVKKFEHANSISINVYTTEEKKVLPIRLATRKMERHVNLLYLEGANGVGHFAWIKNLSCLVSSQLRKHKRRKYFCDRSLHYFSSSGKLETHTIDCEKMNECAIILPDDERKWLSFDNYIRKERLPFVVYADLECILEKTDRETPRSTYQHHKVFSIAYYVQCAYDSSLSVYQCRRDANRVSWFVEELKNMAHFVKLILANNIQLDDLTSEQQEAFRNATHCHICEKPFGENDTRVRDHCYLTGRYRGPAYSNYNLNYKNSFCIPIVFHNLSGYDSHFIIEKIAIAFEGAVDNVANLYVSSIAADSPTGYILEVDLEYPQRLQDIHADLPFCPTRAKPPF
ncbi:uncharacterized protein LOC128889603 [Hylaeus anthracinus]|uniref:uncharacterized protein LOC128889603 n=1 Tax=Hylaeus anthracinus TaxID=313031 RepID=UPI0023B982EF|nr:uncharacterized protein LOC128889603 [Hylaeus anthracinus]